MSGSLGKHGKMKSRISDICIVDKIVAHPKKKYMDKNTTEQKQQLPTPEPRPNRDAYKAAFNEDYPDIDFEDKEARYGAMLGDRKRYREYVKAGKSLSDTFSKHRWVAAMLQDLTENPDKDPVTWMAENGIDIQRALEDDEYRKTIAEKIADYQKAQAEGEQAASERDKNLLASLDNLKAVQKEKGLSDDDAQELWRHMIEDVLDPAMRGDISKETWNMVLRAKNYDKDIETAREQAGMQARNEKVANGLRKYANRMPPSLPQGAGQRVEKPKRQDSFWDDDMKNYH